jgi:hypothetical protein
MKLTIVRADGVVGVDGVFLKIDLSDQPANLHAVQWDGESGHVEWTDKNNTTLTSIAAYQPVIDAWQAAYDDMIARQDPYYGLSEAEKAAQMLQEQKDAIAAQRYAMETAGIEYQGMTILTDRESVQILDSTCEKIRRGLVASIDWKCKDGYLTLTEENIDALEIAILTHVQTAFAWEKAQLESIG